MMFHFRGPGCLGKKSHPITGWLSCHLLNLMSSLIAATASSMASTDRENAYRSTQLLMTSRSNVFASLARLFAIPLYRPTWLLSNWPLARSRMTAAASFIAKIVDECV